MLEPLHLYAGKKTDTIAPIALVKAHWEETSYHERLHTYGARLTATDLVDDPTEAEFFILPAGLNDLSNSFIEQAYRLNKFIIVWEGGDLPTDLPIKNTIHIHAGLHHSRRSPTSKQFGRPSFVSDYLKSHFNGKLTLRGKRKQPTVGFCGHVVAPYSLQSVKYYGQSALSHVTKRVGGSDKVPTCFPPHTVLRARILKELESTSHIHTDFIYRQRYRAGTGSNNDETLQKVSFLNNIIHTDYTICVRGFGNFSTRFYETLCLGRIPIFINTDCVLPFEDHIDWRSLCIWVEEKDLPYIGELVADAHNDIHPDDFLERQKACRDTWETWLTTEGFYSHLPLIRIKVTI